MTIQELFAKLSKPGQKRVAYGIWWAINKMNQFGTKSYCDSDWQIFSQWISYKNADFILPKLDGFKALYNGYKCDCVIDGNMVSVTYDTGMANGNVRVSVSVFDVEKANKQREEEEQKKKEEEEENKILMKMWRHMLNHFKENYKNAKNEELIKEAEKFSEREAEIFKRDLLKICGKN